MKKSILLVSTLIVATAGISSAQSAETLGDHPAVIAARTWNARSIDPNTFIVAHPARLQLAAASPSAKERTEIQASAAAGR